MRPCYPKQSISFCGKGDEATSFEPGDFILVAGKGFYSRLIQFGQNLRTRNSRLTKWTHAALIVNPQGELVEALATGCVLSQLSKYTDREYYVVRIVAFEGDRHEAVDFALSCLNEKYGWGTIISIALSMLTGLKFSFGFDGQQICSGLVARALERTSAIFKHDTSRITPYDLARFYIDGVSE